MERDVGGELGERIAAAGDDACESIDRELGRITISAGVAARNRGEDVDRVMARADLLLYEARPGGRNRVSYALQG